jgi:hypothetical protein
MWEGLTKNWGKKPKKKFPKCLRWHSGKRPFPECYVEALGEVSRKNFLKRCRLFVPSNTTFLFRVPSFPSVALGEDGLPRVSSFPECHALLGTRGSLPSPSAILPRVQHSGKIGFPGCPIFGTRGSMWHSGNLASPVVSRHAAPGEHRAGVGNCHRAAFLADPIGPDEAARADAA